MIKKEYRKDERERRYVWKETRKKGQGSERKRIDTREEKRRKRRDKQ